MKIKLNEEMKKISIIMAIKKEKWRRSRTAPRTAYTCHLARIILPPNDRHAWRSARLPPRRHWPRCYRLLCQPLLRSPFNRRTATAPVFTAVHLPCARILLARCCAYNIAPQRVYNNNATPLRVACFLAHTCRITWL